MSVLTQHQITKIFQQRINYDLRNLLSNSDNTLMDSLTRTMDRDPSYMLSAIQCLRLQPSTRSVIGQALQMARNPDVLYAMLIYKHRLITLVRPQKQSLHPPDLHLIFNMMESSTTFRSAPESWAPICLPKFNPKGFLYAHVSFLDKAVRKREGGKVWFYVTTAPSFTNWESAVLQKLSSLHSDFWFSVSNKLSLAGGRVHADDVC